MILSILILISSYLIGAIPFGYLLTKKYKRLKITEIGSGNIGSTNVRRIAGRALSCITQILDMIKGIVCVFICQILLNNQVITYDFLIYFAAITCIIGHDFSVFIRFKGGKGVNTSMGASLLIAPWPVLISGFIFLIFKKASGYTSVGSIFIAFSLSISGYLLCSAYDFYYLLTVSILIIILHTKNIIRLVKGKELR